MSEKVVLSRLDVLRRLVEGPAPEEERGFVPAASEELRRRVSACLRLAARRRLGTRSESGCSEVVGLLKGLVDKEAACSDVLAGLGVVCAGALDKDELVAVVDAVGADGRVRGGVLKKYVLHGDSMAEIATRLRRSLGEDDVRVFAALVDKPSGFVSVKKLHRWIAERLDLDLTKSEIHGVLRTMNDLAGVAENGPDVDWGSFCQFKKTQNVSRRLKQRLETEAIVDVRVSVSRKEEDDLRAQGYAPVLDHRDQPCDVGRRVTVWFLKRSDSRLRPIVDVRVEISRTNTALAVVGYTCLDRNLNVGGLQRPKYLWVARGAPGTTAGVVDLRATVGRAKVVDDPIHLEPKKGSGSYLPLEGSLGAGSVILWVRRQGNAPRLRKPAAAFAEWSTARRRLECELSCRLAVREHAPSTKNGAPDLTALFHRHAKNRLGKTEFARLLRDVGFNVEALDRHVLMSRLAVSSRAEKLSLDVDDFVSFFALADRELDEIAQRFKTTVRAVNPGPLRDLFDEITRCGSPNLTLAELAQALRHVGHFLTANETSRLARRWSTESMDGEVDAAQLLRFLETRVDDDDVDDALETAYVARRSAARVQLSAEALRVGALEATRPPEATWAALVHRRTRRLRRFCGLLQWGSKGESDAGVLEADDLALALEPQARYSGATDRLCPKEYGQLVAIVAPSTESGHIDADAFGAFVESPLRPLAELVRILDKRLLRSDDRGEEGEQGERGERGELIELYAALARGEDAVVSATQYRDCLLATLESLGLVDTAGFPKRLSVANLRKECIRSARRANDGGDDGALNRISLAEWACLAQHTASDLEKWWKHDCRAGRVDAQLFIEGLCRLVVRDDSAPQTLALLKPGKTNDRRLSVACRDVAKRVSRRRPDQGADEWLRTELASRGLPGDAPFKRLLQCFNQDHGWRLDDAHLEVLSNAVGGDPFRTSNIEAFVKKHHQETPPPPHHHSDDDDDLERHLERHDVQRRGLVDHHVFDRVARHFLHPTDVARLARDFDRHGLVAYRDACRFIATYSGYPDAHAPPADRPAWPLALRNNYDHDDDEDDSTKAELVRAMRPAAAKLRHQQQNGLDVLVPFRIVDHDGTGLCSIGDFRDVLRRFDLPLSAGQIDIIAEHFAVPGRNHEVAYDKFLKAMAHDDPRDDRFGGLSRSDNYATYPHHPDPWFQHQHPMWPDSWEAAPQRAARPRRAPEVHDHATRQFAAAPAADHRRNNAFSPRSSAATATPRPAGARAFVADHDPATVGIVLEDDPDDPRHIL